MIDLRLGDCLEIMRGLPDGCVDAVITDPPYPSLVGNYNWNWTEGNGVAGRNRDWNAVGVPWGESLEWTKEAWRISKRGLIIFCSYHSVSEIRSALPEAKPVALLTWYHRNTPPRGKNVPRHTNEFIWLLRKNGGMLWDKIKDTVIDMPRLTAGCMATERILNDDGSTAHPTQKPVRLMEKLCELVPDGETILDPFMGSGTTGVACVKLNRSFIGIEINPDYFAIAQKRIAEAQRQMVLL